MGNEKKYHVGLSSEPQSVDNEQGLLKTNVILLLIAVLVLVLYHNHVLSNWFIDPYPLLLKELAFAIIIAVILIYTIEKANRASHERAADALIGKINVDLFHAIYKRTIPPAVFAEVEKCLLRSRVYREDYRLIYTLNKLDGVEGYLRCTAESNYIIKNITDASVEHTVKLLVEMPIEKDMTKYCSIESIEIDGRRLSQDEVKKNLEADTELQMNFSQKIEIPAGASVTVKTRALLVKRLVDEEIWRCVLPSSGIKLQVVTPASDLRVSAVAFHSEKFLRTYGEDNEGGTFHSWELNYGIFPHQAIAFFWRPADVAQAAEPVSG
ncbi:MAG: hypothetical protein JWQ01_2995 [Massilia sp.]|nr:hypothetical protein [Massilia sp.]